MEGFYNPDDGSITLIAENLRDENHAQFVAWHELGHRKADLNGYDQWAETFKTALNHEAVKQIARSKFPENGLKNSTAVP